MGETALSRNILLFTNVVRMLCARCPSRHRIAVSLSPKKEWEGGAVGGLVSME